MRTSIRLFPLLTMILVCDSLIARAAEASFSITITTPKSVLKVASDIPIDIIIRNISDGDIDLPRSVRLDLGEWFTDVEVSDEKGNMMPETKYYRVLRGKDIYDSEPRPDGKFVPKTQSQQGLSGYSVKPGETLRDGLVLNKLVDLTRPGKYAVRVRRRDEATKVWVTSNAITVTLTE